MHASMNGADLSVQFNRAKFLVSPCGKWHSFPYMATGILGNNRTGCDCFRAGSHRETELSVN
jgi:hypothetical protein